MYEIAKRLLVYAGGNQNTSMFNPLQHNGILAIGIPSNSAPHRTLHICSFLIGLYSLGLSNQRGTHNVLLITIIFCCFLNFKIVNINNLQKFAILYSLEIFKTSLNFKFLEILSFIHSYKFLIRKHNNYYVPGFRFLTHSSKGIDCMQP